VDELFLGENLAGIHQVWHVWPSPKFDWSLISRVGFSLPSLQRVRDRVTL